MLIQQKQQQQQQQRVMNEHLKLNEELRVDEQSGWVLCVHKAEKSHKFYVFEGVTKNKLKSPKKNGEKKKRNNKFT